MSMKRESRIGVTTAMGKRARALIWAHLLRVELNDKELQSGKLPSRAAMIEC